MVFDLLKQPPAESLPIHILAWVDVNDDDKIDLSSEGPSEVARTIYKFNSESNGKAVLTFYNFNAGPDPFYTATALEGATNVIVTEDFLKGWMAVLPQDTEEPVVFDTDGDGLSDNVETRLGTSVFEVDTDFDGETDFDEVGPDNKAPLDTDGDTIIDALESSARDDDADGTNAELDADDFNACAPSTAGDACDTDLDGINNGDERLLGLNPDLADSDADGRDDLAELGSVFGPIDTDADGTIDALDLDSDNDLVNDADEADTDGDLDGVPAWRDADEQP